MTARNTERGRHILAWNFFEQTQRDDCFLHGAQLLNARAEPHMILRAREQIFRDDPFRIESFVVHDFQMRTCVGVKSPVIARSVTHDAGQQRAPFLRIFRQIIMPLQIQKCAQRFLHAIDGVFRARAFCACNRCEAPAIVASERAESIESFVHASRKHRSRGGSCLQIFFSFFS